MAKASEDITVLCEKLREEEEKAAAGNYSAGTRARKILMEIKKRCGTARDEIQQWRKAAA